MLFCADRALWHVLLACFLGYMCSILPGERFSWQRGYPIPEQDIPLAK